MEEEEELKESIEIDWDRDPEEVKTEYYQTMIHCLPRLVEELHRANCLKALEMDTKFQELKKVHEGEDIDYDLIEHKIRCLGDDYLSM